MAVLTITSAGIAASEQVPVPRSVTTVQVFHTPGACSKLIAVNAATLLLVRSFAPLVARAASLADDRKPAELQSVVDEQNRLNARLAVLVEQARRYGSSCNSSVRE